MGPLSDKSQKFAVRMAKLRRMLNEKQREYILAGQLVRSGTAIGALVCESEYAQSRLDFISKLSIALKEANETRYWLTILYEAGYITEVEYKSVVSDCSELVAMLVASIRTAKGHAKTDS